MTGDTLGSDRGDHAAVRAAHASMMDAMVLGDVAALDQLLADDYTLTHMTGYVQGRAEWLADIDTDRMAYHSIEDVELAVRDDGAGAVLTARSMTEATIWGAHGTWRLQLRTEFEPTPDGWFATRTIASTW